MSDFGSRKMDSASLQGIQTMSEKSSPLAPWELVHMVCIAGPVETAPPVAGDSIAGKCVILIAVYAS